MATATIKEYIGKNKPKAKKNKQQNFQLAYDSYMESQARVFMSEFNGMTKKTFNAKALSAQERYSLSRFILIVQKLETLKVAGIYIKNIDYIAAHKWYFGEDLQSWQLLTDCSYGIYQSYMRQKKTPEIHFSEKEYNEYDEKTIANLASVRGESPEEVRSQMEAYGFL